MTSVAQVVTTPVPVVPMPIPVSVPVLSTIPVSIQPPALYQQQISLPLIAHQPSQSPMNHFTSYAANRMIAVKPQETEEEQKQIYLQSTLKPMDNNTIAIQSSKSMITEQQPIHEMYDDEHELMLDDRFAISSLFDDNMDNNYMDMNMITNSNIYDNISEDDYNNLVYDHEHTRTPSNFSIIITAENDATEEKIDTKLRNAQSQYLTTVTNLPPIDNKIQIEAVIRSPQSHTILTNNSIAKELSDAQKNAKKTDIIVPGDKQTHIRSLSSLIIDQPQISVLNLSPSNSTDDIAMFQPQLDMDAVFAEIINEEHPPQPSPDMTLLMVNQQMDIHPSISHLFARRSSHPLRQIIEQPFTEELLQAANFDDDDEQLINDDEKKEELKESEEVNDTPVVDDDSVEEKEEVVGGNTTHHSIPGLVLYFLSHSQSYTYSC